MNKTKKRQLSMKNKLIAAVAMLLVSSIMMVSTTYAWFTLSTAPEVQGITTTIGANGNLEIALAHPTGNNSLIGTVVGDATKPWLEKNLTWGNLLNLEEGYSLDQLTLLPSRLNITAASQTNPATLSGSPLMIPVYGSDGRISALDGNKMNYGAKDPEGNNFLVNPTINGMIYKGYGVRALGTSSTQSETELNFQTALNAVNTYRGQANSKASGAIFAYGSALADMAVMHAAASGNDTNDYAAFVPQLQGMINELDDAADLIELSLINTMVALSNANIPYDADGNGSIAENETVGDAMIGEQTVREYLKNTNLTMTLIWNNIPAGVKAELEEQFPALVQSYNLWNANNTQITSTKTKIDALAQQEGTILWTAISPALSGLMNTDHVTLNGMELDGLDKTQLLQNIASLNLELADGSGVLANFGKLTGNLSATVVLSENAVYAGESLAGVKINLITTSEPAGGPLLTQIRVKINTVGAVKSNDSTNAIDVIYGYVLDFVFRTNAANSNLLLQTEGAQRIYENGTNAATMGLGSTMTFASKYSDLQSLASMMSGIRVVFTSTQAETTEVYGIAKVVMNDIVLPLALNSGTLASVEVPAEIECDPSTYEFVVNEGAAATGVTVYMTATEVNGMVHIALKTGDHQYVVVEEYEDQNTEGKDYRWSVWTAMWYEKTTVTEVNGENQIVVEEIELKDAQGKTLFYPHKTLTTSTGVINDVTDDEILEIAETAVNYTADEKVHNTDANSKTMQQAVLDNAKDVEYYFVHDEDNASVEVEAPLYLHTYTVHEEGVLGFGEPMAVQTLTGLGQNVITEVSALVYLDGDYVDNTMVGNSEDGISNTGKLNLQFASSANLIPMENTSLKDGKSYDVVVNKPDGVPVYTTSDKASEGADYSFAMATNTYVVSYAVEDGATGTLTGQLQSYAGQTGYVYTIPAEHVTGKITITVTEPVVEP